VNPETMWKGRPMWIYDGEQWTEEGANENATKQDANMPRLDEFYPELQVIEVEIVPTPRYVPFTLP
jgi:hypothetical protein